MTEAIHLGKPMLAMPFDGQAEQILNANYLVRLGWGERCAQLTADALRSFLGRAPAYAERLKTFVHDGNAELFRSIDTQVAVLTQRHGATG
jgi:UDP:flavonoid glycosyltransferase YjiC (YdhE family)